jgi:hypothetical protein
MNETRITSKLNIFFATADYKLSNVFIFDWESDFFCITSSGYSMEVEVKISRSDFKADFKKTQKHHMLKNATKSLVTIPGYSHRDFSYVSFVKPKCPNKFFYCCPENLIDPKEVPDFAGLLYWNENSGNIRQVKGAKWLHKNKLDLSKALLQKYYYMYLNLRNDYNQLVYHVNEIQDAYINSGFDITVNKKNLDIPAYYQPELWNNEKNEN